MPATPGLRGLARGARRRGDGGGADRPSGCTTATSSTGGVSAVPASFPKMSSFRSTLRGSPKCRRRVTNAAGLHALFRLLEHGPHRPSQSATVLRESRSGTSRIIRVSLAHPNHFLIVKRDYPTASVIAPCGAWYRWWIGYRFLNVGRIAVDHSTHQFAVDSHE